MLRTFDHFLEGSQLFLVTAGRLVSKDFKVFFGKIFVHFLEGNQLLLVRAGRLVKIR